MTTAMGQALDAEADAILKRGLGEAWNAGFRCACDLLEGRLKDLASNYYGAAPWSLGYVTAEAALRHLAAVRSRVPAAPPEERARQPRASLRVAANGVAANGAAGDAAIPVVTLGQGDYTCDIMPEDLL